MSINSIGGIMAQQGSHEESMDVAESARQKEWKHPSFAGQLFLGKFDPSLIHPFPKQPQEDKEKGDAFVEKVEAFMKEYIRPEEIDASREIPKEAIDKMAEMGIFAMKVPKEYDGLGLSQTNYNRAVMKVASYCGSTAVLISAHQSIGVPQPLKLYGTKEQKEKYFPRFRKGAISAFALTEPEVGSDPARMSAEAVLSEDGSHYILNGNKLWCTNGVVADLIVVMARTAPKMIKGKERQQITAFIVEMDTPGVEVSHRCHFMGLNAIYNGVIEFDNVKIPVEDRLGDEGRGLAMALETINVGRLTLPAASTAACKQCLAICRKWGKERVQWGQPIGLHEAGREKIAYIAATTFAMEALTWLTSSWADEGKVDLRIEAAMAKMFCTEETWKITDMTLQLRGGRGYEKASSLIDRGEPGYPVERMLRDCRINMILEGSTEIMKLFLTREAIDPHFSRLKSLIKGKFNIKEILSAVGHYSLWLPGQYFKSLSTSSHSEFGKLANHMQFVEKTSHKLARILFLLMARYQKGLEKKQLILFKLMEIGTDLFNISTTCAYARSLNTENAEELADYFCRLARRRINERFKALKDNDDKMTNLVGKRVIDRDYLWMEEGVIPMVKD